MPNVLVAICALLYLGSAVWFLILGRPFWAGVYAMYAGANVFLILASKEA